MQKLWWLPLFLLSLLYSCTPEQSNEAEKDVAASVADTPVALPETLEEERPASVEEEFKDEIELPADLGWVSEARGDLTKDGVPERVLVVETIPPADADEGYVAERYVRIYEQRNGQWALKQQIFGGVLDSDSGGMMGDPFESISVERGCLVLVHTGGSRIKWNYTHRYRRQNEKWELIGATINYGAPCDYWHEFDYNLSTGIVEGNEEREDCDEDVTSTQAFRFKHEMSPLPNLTEHVPGSVAVKVPDTDIEFYF